MSAKILHVQPCSVFNILGVAASTEQHKVFGRRVLLLTLAWLHDQWRRWRYPSVALQLPPLQHSQHAGSRRSRLGATRRYSPRNKTKLHFKPEKQGNHLHASSVPGGTRCSAREAPRRPRRLRLRHNVAQDTSVTQKAAYSITMSGAFPTPASQQRPRGAPDS